MHGYVFQLSTPGLPPGTSAQLLSSLRNLSFVRSSVLPDAHDTKLAVKSLAGHEDVGASRQPGGRRDSVGLGGFAERDGLSRAQGRAQRHKSWTGDQGWRLQDHHPVRGWACGCTHAGKELRVGAKQELGVEAGKTRASQGEPRVPDEGRRVVLQPRCSLGVISTRSKGCDLGRCSVASRAWRSGRG